MKKTCLLILCCLFICSCSINKNTPKNIVTQYLDEYINLSDNVVSDINKKVNKTNYSSDNKKLFIKVIKRQYKNLKYTVINEDIDNDKAVVKVNIEVFDYNKALDESTNDLIKDLDQYYNLDNSFNNDKYDTLKLNKMYDFSDRVNYEIIFYLTKTNNKWKLVNLNNDDLNKLNGLYKSN